MWTRVWLASVSCCIQLAIGSALLVRAQEPPDPARYQMLLDEGMREHDLRNFAEARSLLTRAYLHFPNARALRAIGMAEYELGSYAASAASLAAALASEVYALEDAQREETEQLLARAENFLTHVTVFARPWPTVVLLDGELVPLAPGGQLVLEVGDHELTVFRPGYFEEHRRIRAVGAEWLSVELVLTPLLVTPLPEHASRAPSLQAEASPAPRQRWLWSGALLVSAALAAGLGFALSDRHPDERAPIAANPIAIRRGP